MESLVLPNGQPVTGTQTGTYNCPNGEAPKRYQNRGENWNTLAKGDEAGTAFSFPKEAESKVSLNFRIFQATKPASGQPTFKGNPRVAGDHRP